MNTPPSPLSSPKEAGTAELEALRAQLAATVRKATIAVEAGEAAEARAKAAEGARAQVNAVSDQRGRYSSL